MMKLKTFLFLSLMTTSLYANAWGWLPPINGVQKAVSEKFAQQTVNCRNK